MLDQGYGILPNRVLFDDQLSSTAKLLFVYITSLCASRGFCFASNEHMAQKFGISQSQVSRLIASLDKYIEISNGNNEKRTIRLRKNAEVPTQKPQGSLRKNAEHNNTSSNNTSIIIPPISPKAVPPVEAIQLAILLRDRVTENYAWIKTTEKQVAAWASDIEKLHRIDGHDWQVIKAVIEWSAQDNFWKQNIKSGTKLRKQFDNLLIRIKSEPQRMAVIS